MYVYTNIHIYIYIHNIYIYTRQITIYIYIIFVGGKWNQRESLYQFVPKPGPGIPTSSTPYQQPAQTMPQVGEGATSGPETLVGGGHTSLTKVQSFANSVLWTGRAILSNYERRQYTFHPGSDRSSSSLHDIYIYIYIYIIYIYILCIHYICVCMCTPGSDPLTACQRCRGKGGGRPGHRGIRLRVILLPIHMSNYYSTMIVSVSSYYCPYKSRPREININVLDIVGFACA